MGIFGAIMKIVMIVLVSVLTVFIILGAILMIFPSVSIFGLHYISCNYDSEMAEYLRSEESAQTKAMWDNADFYRVETRGYDVLIRVKETGQRGETYQAGSLASVVNSSYKGFVWGGDAYKPTYSSSIKENRYIEENGQNIFFVKMSEPDGFLVRSETLLTLVVETNTFADKKLEINTQGGNVTIGGDINNAEKLINTNNLKINAGTGTVTLANMSVSENLEITKKSGNIKSEKNIDAKTTITISEKYGLIELLDIGTAENPQKATIKTTNNTHTTIKNVYGGFEFKADRGLLEVDNITDFTDLNVGSCDSKIKNIQNGLNVVGGDGYVKIQDITGEATITMKNGSVTLDKASKKVVFESENGGLKISDAGGDVYANTTRGNIDVNCAGNTINLNINNKHGNTNFTGAKGQVLINTSSDFDAKGTGSITGTFTEISGNSSIFGYAGDINLTVPQNSWLLSWRNVQGEVNIKMGDLDTKERTTSGYLKDTSNTEKWIDVVTMLQSEKQTDSNTLLVTNNSGKINITASLA